MITVIINRLTEHFLQLRQRVIMSRLPYLIGSVYIREQEVQYQCPGMHLQIILELIDTRYIVMVRK